MGCRKRSLAKEKRFIHDGWVVGSMSGAMRRYHRTRIEPEKKNEPPAITTIEYIPTSADEIWSLVDDEMVLAGVIQMLATDLKKGTQKSSLDKPLREYWSARRKPAKATKAMSNKKRRG